MKNNDKKKSQDQLNDLALQRGHLIVEDDFTDISGELSER